MNPKGPPVHCGRVDITTTRRDIIMYIKEETYYPSVICFTNGVSVAKDSDAMLGAGLTPRLALLLLVAVVVVVVLVVVRDLLQGR